MANTPSNPSQSSPVAVSNPTAAADNVVKETAKAQVAKDKAVADAAAALQVARDKAKAAEEESIAAAAASEANEFETPAKKTAAVAAAKTAADELQAAKWAVAEAEAKVIEATAAAVPGPFNLTTDDRFILKDTNSDGLFDTIVVERHDRVAEAKVKADAVRYADFNAAVAAARAEAIKSHTGKPADEVATAVKLAEAKVAVNWKGPMPASAKPKSK